MLRDYNEYTKLLNLSMDAKVQDIVPWIPSESKIILDYGSGTGKLSNTIAETFPNCKVIGVDNNEEMLIRARSVFYRDNLEFIAIRGKTLQDIVGQNEVNVIIFSSVLHEVYSYNDDSLYHVKQILKDAASILKNDENSRIIIRDFIRPDLNPSVYLYHSWFDQMSTGHTIVDFVNQWKERFPHRIKSEKTIQIQNTLFLTDLHTVYEYINRKDYFVNWDAELYEKYGFWDQDDIYNICSHLTNLRLIYMRTIPRTPSQQAKLDNKIILVANDGIHFVALPERQVLIVLDKINP